MCKSYRTLCNSLILSQHDGTFMGRLFSSLRLPILTNHPVHLHGLFSITPDRGRLTSSGQSPGSEDFASRWNNFLFVSCIASAWADLLVHRSSASWQEERFSLWPAVTNVPIDQWNSLADVLIDVVINKKLPVWPTAKKCVSIDRGFFSVTNPSLDKYASALTEANIPAVDLDQPMFDKLQQRYQGSTQIKWLTPKTVRQFLRHKRVSTLPNIPRSLSKLLLEYCLLDLQQAPRTDSRNTVYAQLDGIALWPTLDGQLSAYGEVGLLLPRDITEMKLFTDARKARTLDINDMTSQTLEFLSKDVDFLSARFRHRKLADLSEEWPMLYPLIEPSDDSRPWKLRSKGHGETLISDIWKWICARCNAEGKLPTHLDGLWLLPTNNLRLRQYAPGQGSQPMLIVTKGEPLFQLANDLVSRNPDAAPPILDTEVLPVEATMLLKKRARATPKLHGASVDHLESLLDWLVACKGLLSMTTNEQKRAVMQQIETLARNRSLTKPQHCEIASQLRGLPIFSRINSRPPFKKWTIVKCALLCNTADEITHSSSNLVSNHLYQAPINLPPVPDIPGVSLYDLSCHDERNLVERFDLIRKINLLDLLKDYLLPWAVTVSDGPLVKVKEALIEYTFQHLRGAGTMDISNIPIIPLASTDGHERKYRSLLGMVDPASPLTELYFEHEDVFPCPEFYQRHKETLRLCGISTDLSWNTCLDRVEYYSRCRVDVENLEAKVKCLLRLPIHHELGSSPPIDEIRTLKWLPTIPISELAMTLSSSQACRGADESDLVDCVLGATRLQANAGWKSVLGWEDRIDLDVLLRQLDICLSRNDHVKVDRVLGYLQSKFDPAEYSILRSKPCIFGVQKNYLVPKKAFTASELLARYPMAPYLEEVDGHFARTHVKLLSYLDVRKEPTIQDVSEVQALLKEQSKGHLEEPHLDVAISSLEIAAHLLGDQEQAGILIPDTESMLRALPDIVYGDRAMTGPISEFNFTHPKVSTALIQRLGVEHSLARATRLEIEFEDEDEDEFTPREKLSTTISDTLGRYPIDSTFNEFLANADDCHATTISWILDECESGSHESLALLTSELKPLQGPALFVHNDKGQLEIPPCPRAFTHIDQELINAAVFTEKDFAGFREIGQGGKGDDVTTTGMFGRGALTMYHFTDVPMLISGGFILILDPQQELLPKNRHRKRKIGIKLPLKTARRLCQDQLSPFHNLCQYVKDLDYYEGTLFRLPLRTPGKKTTLTDSTLPVDLKVTKTLLKEYFFSACKSLLFLRNVKSIVYHIRGQARCTWSVSADKSEGSEDDIFRRVKISTVWDNGKLPVQEWRVGITDIEQCPADIFNPGRGSHKISECGVAACLSHPLIDQRVFCKLPLLYQSQLPISFHASFAITGDRRTIPWEDPRKDAPIARWNNWLLTNCIPEFYLEFLKDLAPRQGMHSFNFWPSTSGLSNSPLSSAVAKAFWRQMMDDQHIAYEIFPRAVSHSLLTGLTPMKKREGGKLRKLHAVTSLKGAEFDLVPEETSKKLRPLLIKLCPNLVRPPNKIWQNIKDADAAQKIVTLTPTFFCRLFVQESKCTLLEEFLDALATVEGSQSKSEALEKLLQVVVPPFGADAKSLDILDGCRILPKLDGSLGLLTSKPQADMWTFVATEEEQELFYFASHLLVNTKLFRRPPAMSGADLTISGEVVLTSRNPIQDIAKASFNVRSLGIEDLGILLAQSQPPIEPPALSGSREAWILKFWAYVNTRFRAFSKARKSDQPKVTVEELLTKSGLNDRPIYPFESNKDWHYLTPRQFDEGPYMVKPNHRQQMVLCQEIEGLDVVDPACVPYLLVEAEHDLTMHSAFERLICVLSRIEEAKHVQVQEFLSKTLSEASILVSLSLLDLLLTCKRLNRTL